MNYITTIKSYHNNFLMIPLGGTNEIGMNITLYHYLGKWIIIDCGTCFAHDLPGVKMLFPSLEFILPYKKDILGMILTHCHEDHVGAVYYLWEKLKCNIYSTKFTLDFVKRKFPQLEHQKESRIETLKLDSRINLGPFNVEFATLSHSTMEMQSVLINTNVGNILHTGDWKFDNNNFIGPKQNEKSLVKFGKKGVLALICDSTNADSAEKSFSELDVQKNLINIVKSQKKLVVVTTFGSNFARLYSIFIAAKLSKRKIILSGRSIKRVLETARNTGYFDEQDLEGVEFVSDKNFSTHSRSELLVVAAGCQGDKNSSFYSIIEENSSIKLKEDDTVIFSSKIIPGNEKSILAMINKLILKKVNVITAKDELVHVSGHPYVDDLKKMYSIINPKISIPVHGEPIQLNAHAKLAKKWGIEKTIVPTNGIVIKIDADDSRILGYVKSGYIALDGKSFISNSDNVFAVRQTIHDEGAVVVTIIADLAKNKVIKLPIISYLGSLDTHQDRHLIKSIKSEISNLIMTNFGKADLKRKIIKHIRGAIKSAKGKFPYIEINLEDVAL